MIAVLMASMDMFVTWFTHEERVSSIALGTVRMVTNLQND